MTEILILLILFQIKHFVCDFPLQKPYQYLNKGIYGHAGGFLHAAIHSIGTCWVLMVYHHFNSDKITDIQIVTCAFLDLILHYHIDWAKMKINKHYGWRCDNSERFWYLLGFDQLLHQLTYILIIYLAL